MGSQPNPEENVRNRSDNRSEKKENRSEDVRNRSEQNADSFRTVPNESGNVRNETDTRSEQIEEEKPEPEAGGKTLRDLQMENYELRVQLEGQKYLNKKYDEILEGERTRHQAEQVALVDRLTDAREKIGTLEEKLLQLEAPKREYRDAETSSATEPKQAAVVRE